MRLTTELKLNPEKTEGLMTHDVCGSRNSIKPVLSTAVLPLRELGMFLDSAPFIGAQMAYMVSTVATSSGKIKCSTQ